MKHFLYIAQARLEVSTCKIGITDNLDSRLKAYNSATGHSKDNAFEYLFACEVKNLKSALQIENSHGLLTAPLLLAVALNDKFAFYKKLN